jgi:hypothetical protein
LRDPHEVRRLVRRRRAAAGGTHWPRDDEKSNKASLFSSTSTYVLVYIYVGIPDRVRSSLLVLLTLGRVGRYVMFCT